MANPLLAGLLVAATLLPPQGQQDTVPTELRAAGEMRAKPANAKTKGV